MQRLVSFFAAVATCLPMMACSQADESARPNIKPTPEGEQTGKVEIKVGEVLPAWKEGQMDIHFINTTTGESAFVIMPDGTQLLIDAASSLISTNSNGNTTNTGIRSRWDPTLTGTRGGEIVCAYLKKCMAWTGNRTLDYVVMTHFHIDHFGDVNSSTPKSANADYRLNGLTEVMDEFKVAKMIDRGYPDYDYPFDMQSLASKKEAIRNYVTALNWHVANSGTKAEIFKAGSNSQIVPKTSKYDVRVQNIAVNGEIWTGKGTETKKTFPEKKDIVVANPESIAAADKCPPENICSIVMKISYGSFDYFAGADLQYNGRSNFAWKDAELPCAKAAGVVEVMKANHHGSATTNQPEALRALNPQAIVVNSWVDSHPRTAIIAQTQKTLPEVDLFITNFWQGERPAGVDDKVTPEEAASVKGYDGNIVVRVFDGGRKYYIVTTSDSDGMMIVKNVSGPYRSR